MEPQREEIDLHLGSSILLGNLPPYISHPYWTQACARLVTKHTSKWCYFKPTWFCKSQATDFITGLFNYITQGHISVYFLHIFKRMWDGFHISFHSWKRKTKGKWTFGWVDIYGLLHCKIKRLDTVSWSLIPEFKLSLLGHVLVHAACLIMFIQSSCNCSIWHSITFLSFLLSFFLVLNNPDTFLTSLQFSDFAHSNQRWINNPTEKTFLEFCCRVPI